MRLFLLSTAVAAAALCVLFLVPLPISTQYDVFTSCRDVPVVFEGRVVSVSAHDSLTILHVADAVIFPVVVFDSIDVAEGERVRVKGRVTDYKGELEVVAEEVEDA